MKRLLYLITIFNVVLCDFASAIEIARIEPAFWWVGMKNTELQIMVHGKDIGRADVQVYYPGVLLKRIVKADSPNYLFVYLEITKEAQPGTIRLTFSDDRNKKTKMVKSIELKPRASTVGAQGFSSADVLYLIMPDRFANGNPNNDFWDDETVDRDEPFARHGGDLAGIQQHLNYIDDLGVTTVWLNPVLENKMNSPEKYKSYHGYAITDFYKIDKRLGSNEEYCQLIESIHEKGMKIVMDMIYNHCGSRHWWLNDLPFYDWLNHSEGYTPTTHNLYTAMDVHAPQSEKDAMTDGWFVPSMPDLNQRNPHLATYLIQNSIWWIEYARIDGIRHDTHPYVDYDFLSRWCRAISDEYPDFNIVGETWYDNSAPLAWWQASSRESDPQSNLKTVMDFRLMTAANQSFSVENVGKNPLRQLYETIALDFLYKDLRNILVFLDNHDTDRFFKKDETVLNRYKQALAFILTTRGIPQIYYGDEILMYGEKRDGDGNLRKDFPGGWTSDSVNAFTSEGRADLQNEAYNYLKKLLQWRKNSKAVTTGTLIHYAPDYQNECYVYARIADNNRVLVILNGSNQTQTLSTEKYFEVIDNTVKGIDIISGQTIDLKDKITVPAKGVLILE